MTRALALGGLVVCLALGESAPRARPPVGLVQTSPTTFQAEWDHERLDSQTSLQFQAQLWRPEIVGGTQVWAKVWNESELTLVNRRTETRQEDTTEPPDGTLEDVVYAISTWRTPNLSPAGTDPNGPYEIRLRSRLITGTTTTTSAWVTATFTWPLEGGIVVLRPPGKPTPHR